MKSAIVSLLCIFLKINVLLKLLNQGSHALKPRLNFSKLFATNNYIKQSSNSWVLNSIGRILSFWNSGSRVLRKLRRGFRALEPIEEILVVGIIRINIHKEKHLTTLLVKNMWPYRSSRFSIPMNLVYKS